MKKICKEALDSFITARFLQWIYDQYLEHGEQYVAENCNFEMFAREHPPESMVEDFGRFVKGEEKQCPVVS